MGHYPQKGRILDRDGLFPLDQRIGDMRVRDFRINDDFHPQKMDQFAQPMDVGQIRLQLSEMVAIHVQHIRAVTVFGLKTICQLVEVTKHVVLLYPRRDDLTHYLTTL